jgi:hypothetical protein
MARGMVVNEAIVSQASTNEFREGHERTFGPSKVERGRFIWDETQQKLVRAEDYVAPSRALDAPVMAGRFYEGASFNDGEKVHDLGSRSKHRAFMREKGWATADDFEESWTKAEQARDARRTEQKLPDKSRREAVARALYEIENRKR